MQEQEKFSERLTTVFDKKILPILVLLILPPVISEVLYGSVPLSLLFTIIPDIGLLGCGALLIRFIVVSRKLRDTSIVLLGLSLALAIEFAIKQTSLAPIITSSDPNGYGRVYGINLIYMIWAVVYESIWGFYIPIKMFDFIFPDRKDDPMFGFIGFVITGIGFSLGVYASWYTWTQLIYPIYYNTTAYVPNYTTMLQGLIISIILIYIALRNKTTDKRIKTLEPIPHIVLIGVTMFVISLSWFGLLLFAYGVFPTIPIEQPILFSLIMIVVASVALFYWPKSTHWTDSTSIVVLFSVLLASMFAGTITSGISQPLDILSKIVFDFIAVLALVFLYQKYQSQSEKDIPKKKNRIKI